MSARSGFPLELRVAPGRGASAALHRQLREGILEGRLATGFRLPPTREVAQMLGLARTTVVLAYDMLVAEGYVRVRHGDGTFVQSVRRAAVTGVPRHAPTGGEGDASRLPRLDLRLGFPDVSGFPFESWRRMEARAWRAIGRNMHVVSCEPAGVHQLREAIVGHASHSRAVSCVPADVVVTAGAQQAFDLLARTLVTQPSTVVAVENPGYASSRAAFAHAGAEIVGIPVDEQGIVVSRIPTSARVVCVTPSHQFPLGVTMSPQRRAELLEHARRWDAYIVEDDYDCEYRYDSRPLDALQTLAPGRVCYVGTFSKTMFPTLRIGFAVVPEALIERLLDIKMVADGFGAPAPQLALAEFIAEGHLHRHVRRMQRVYAQRRSALLDGLERRLRDRIRILPSTAGLQFSIQTLGDVDWERVRLRARRHALAFERCSTYSMGDEAGDCLAIGFGLLKDEQVPAAIDALAAILD